MNGLSEFIINALFPQRCLGCGRLGTYVCPVCQATLIFIDRDICAYCRVPSHLGLTHPICIRRYGLDGIKSIYRYTPLLRRIIKNIKYRGVFEIVSDMIPYTFVTMGEYVHYYKSLVPVPVFIPVPLHQARQRSRGFNQSQLISDIWHAGLGFDVESTLISRVRNTPPQALLGSAKKRYENVRGAFFINTNKSDIVNNNYIIVDDVWTTGSTIKEMCGILKRAGARKVFALCLAH